MAAEILDDTGTLTVFVRQHSHESVGPRQGTLVKGARISVDSVAEMRQATPGWLK
jgi:hypothetical protein